MIPEFFFNRQWPAFEPPVFGSIAILGGGITLGLASVASTPEQYGGVFIAFLVFLGTGVMGVVSFATVYIAKSVSKTLADMAGGQAQKLFRMMEPDALTKTLSDLSEASIKRDEEIVDRLEVLKDGLEAMNRTTALLNQELEHQVKRGDRLETHVYTQRPQS